MEKEKSVRQALLTLGLYKSSGGPAKSVRAMQQALSAEVLSWVDPREVANERLIWENTRVVRGSGRPLLRSLLYPARGQTREAETFVAGSRLVSCHSYWRWHNLWMAKMGRRYKVPYWFVPHGALDPYVFEEQEWIKKAFLSWGGRRFIEEAACVIFTARAERDKAFRVCQPKRSEIIYWPLEEADLEVERNPSERIRIRQSLDIPETERCLLYFGRLDPMKRPLETIDALAAAGTEAHLIVMGNEFGVSLAECRRHASSLGIGKRVHVVGPVYGREKVAYFSAVDAYISLSRRENFNFTAAESMAAGLPVLLSPGNDLGGEVGEVDCGWIAEDDSPAAAAAKVRQGVQAPEAELREKGTNGRKWAKSHLGFDSFQKKIRKLAFELGESGSNNG